MTNTPSDYLLVLERLKSLTAHDMTRVLDLMRQQLTTPVTLLQTVAEHLLLAGGKHLRPMLCLVTAQLWSKTEWGNNAQQQNQWLINLAAAVELLHQATLFHDDVVDDSDLRRGKKTANNIWGNAMPVLVGDFLFARAFGLMVAVENKAVLELLSQTAATLALGEVWQLSLRHQLSQQQAPNPNAKPASTLAVSYDDYYAIIRAKTASLFSTALTVAALLKSDKTAQMALSQYGEKIGVIFQMVDDMLDYFSNRETIGKQPANDFLEGKITLPVILLIQELQHRQDKTQHAELLKLIESCFFSPSRHPHQELIENHPRNLKNFQQLQQAMQTYDIKTKAEILIKREIVQATEALRPLPNCAAKELLYDFANSSHTRFK